MSFMGAEAIRKSLEGSGLRCTPQRFAVMAYLRKHTGHPTAAEIFAAVNRADPRSSRATTYNNLRDLVQAGLVREVAVEGRAARFDAKGMRHHHFICDRCGKVEDMKWYDVPRPASRHLSRRIFRECELIFRGLCAKCAAPRASRSVPSACSTDRINGTRRPARPRAITQIKQRGGYIHG
jgi:Fur family peroxide stress response transcriptional regulator